MRLPVVGGEADELSRLERLSGADSTIPQTLRAPSRMLQGSRAHLSLISPELFVGSNSHLPSGFNDGPLWQGRGTNLSLLAGGVLRMGRVQVVLAPQYVQSQNLEFQVIPYPQTGSASNRRSPWANPFHPAPAGIDLPFRQGDRPIRRIEPGQSSISVGFGGVTAGLSTENVWWGPALQDPITLGAQGPGVPAAFVRTTSPRRTRAGTFDTWLLVGRLEESAFFDANAGNDARGLGAAALTWRPPRASALELGVARLVIDARGPSGGLLLAPFTSVGRPNGPDSLDPGPRDQITSFWGRWAQPGAGFEAYAEWARFEEPASIRDFLLFPGHSQGYTVGFQWRRPVGAQAWRIWAEASYFEPSPSLRLRPVGASFVSQAAPQGFTVRGQMLGPGIGPGSSAQWMGGDWITRSLRVGAYAARVRWDNAALFTPVVPQVKREDFSLIGGLKASGEIAGVRAALDWAHSVRLNYLFQTYLVNPADGRTAGIDIVNDALTLTLSAPLRFAR